MSETEEKKFSARPIINYPTYKLTDTIFIRKTDEKFAKQLVKFWTDTDVSSLSISLKCPITMTRLKLPCRGQDCTHLQCFDGHSFLKMNEKQFGKWLCNICQKPAPLNKLYVDGLVLDILKSVSEDINDIFFDENGNWNDSKEDKKDISVIDLSDTLEVIDLTGSDVENTPKKTNSDKNGTSSEECDKNKTENSKSKDLKSDDKENVENSRDAYLKLNTNLFVKKNMPSTNNRLLPYTKTNPRKRQGQKEKNHRNTYNLRRPLHDQNNRYNHYVSQNPNQKAFEVLVNAPNFKHLNPNCYKLNIYFSEKFNVLKQR